MDKARERENTPLAAAAPNRYRSIDALNITVDATEELACPICRSSANTDYDYFSRAFGESRRFAATSEAVTETLGFCPQHGAILLSQTHLSRGIVRVFRDVIPRLIPLLVEKHIYEDQVQRIFFAADNACPACAYHNRTAARHIRRLARQFPDAPGSGENGQFDTFCFRHFRILANELSPDIHMAALTRYADALDHAARTMKELLQSFGGEVEAQAVIEQSRQHYARVLDSLKKRLTKKSIKSVTELAVGHPAEQIILYAERHGIDHIVVGHRGHASFERWLLGSVARHVIDHAQRAVTVVRQRT